MADVNKPAGSGAYLGPGTKIIGKLHFDGPATIEGEVEGEIVALANVTNAQEAIVKGKIKRSLHSRSGKGHGRTLWPKRNLRFSRQVLSLGTSTRKFDYRRRSDS